MNAKENHELILIVSLHRFEGMSFDGWHVGVATPTCEGEAFTKPRGVTMNELEIDGDNAALYMLGN